MMLSARVLTDVSNVNSFDYAASADFNEGDVATIYFQLVDVSKDKALGGWKPAGRRYMPAAGAALSITLDSVDTEKKITRTATQPFVQDPSIWKIDILPTDAGKLRGTITARFVLVEGLNTLNGSLRAALRVGVASNSNCAC